MAVLPARQQVLAEQPVQRGLNRAPLSENISSTLLAKDLGFFRIFNATPHGAELLNRVSAPTRIVLPSDPRQRSSKGGHVGDSGSPARVDVDVPDCDSDITLHYRAAGLIIMGASNVPELGLSIDTRNRLFGATRHP